MNLTWIDNIYKKWKDIKEYADSRIQFASLSIKNNIETLIQPAIDSLKKALDKKQDKLRAGKNITIRGNVISAKDPGVTLKAGKNISIGSNQEINAEGYTYNSDTNRYEHAGAVYMLGVGGYNGSTTDNVTPVQTAFAKVVQLTQAQYNNLNPPEPTTLYIITDAL